MAAEYPHISRSEDGTARLSRRPRIRVAQIVMDHFAHGWSVEEMCRQHPDLEQREAHAAMLYYWDHRDEIDREIRKEWRLAGQEAKKARLPAAVELRLRATA